MNGQKTRYNFYQNIDEIYDKYHEDNNEVYGEQDDQDIDYIFKLI